MPQGQDKGTNETYRQVTGSSRAVPQRCGLFIDQDSDNAEQGGDIKLQYGVGL